MEKGNDPSSHQSCSTETGANNADEDKSSNSSSEMGIIEIAEKSSSNEKSSGNDPSAHQNYSTENGATKDGDKGKSSSLVLDAIKEIAIASDPTAHEGDSTDSGNGDTNAGKDKSASPLDDKVLDMNILLPEKADSSASETGTDKCPSPVFDAEVLDMIEIAEKAVIVLSMHLNDSCEGKLDRNRVKMVSVALLKIVSFVNSADTKQKVAFVNGMLAKTLILEGLGAYFMQHWTDMKPCFDPFCVQLCHLSSSLLTTASDLSDAAKARLVELGLVTSLLQALNTFKEANFNDTLRNRVLSSLILLTNCSEQALEYHEFDNATKVIKVLVPYLKSTDLSIRFTAHGIAVHLGVLLSEDNLKELVLTPMEINELIKALGIALKNPDLSVNVFGIRISAREIISEMDLSMVVENNQALLLRSEVHNFILSAFNIGNEDTVEAAIYFFWTIVIASHQMTVDLQEQFSVASPILEKLSTNNTSISKLAKYVLLSLQPDLHLSTKSALDYIEGCYHYNRFHECQRVADAISKEPLALLFKAKCLFKLYRRALNLYELENLDQPNTQQYLAILKNVKAVISMLGTALRKGCIDEEGKEQLDISIMNLIRGSNELNKVMHPRCMLCLHSDITLQKSHVYPRSLLKEFAESIEEREGGRLFTMINTTSPKWLYHYSSPKDVRFFMLCSQCEDLVNKGGEIDFHQSFFLQIYNKFEPSQVMKQTTVGYGRWLYYFCISLVFRCIASGTGIPELVNKHEIYSLFLAFREFLLSPDEASEDSLPKVYLFINPTQVPSRYEHCCLRETLNAPGFFTIQSNDLSDGLSVRPLKAHFAIAHCGIINILLKFLPADEVLLPSNWEINPQGGEYIIPAESDREKDIPEGVWSMFQQISKCFHHHITESLFRKKDKPPEVKASQHNSGIATHQYPHQEAWNKSGILANTYLHNPELFSVLSMLPSGFKIDRLSSEVILPPSFIVLTHHTFTASDGGEVTLLVGVKESTKGGMPVPFVIYCRFVTLGGFFVGFSVKFDKDDYQLNNLCETDLHQHSEEIRQSADAAEKFIGDFLPTALTKKGFANFQSLVHIHFHNALISSMDVKCHVSSHCWYCKDLCENCLSPGGFGPELTSKSKTGISLKFCSQNCAQYFTGSEEKLMSLEIEILPPQRQQSTPKTLLQITGSGMLKMDEGVRVICSIHHGYFSKEYPDGRFSIFCQLRSLFSQKFVEMFVSEKAIPEEPLPHADCQAGYEMVTSLKGSGTITRITISALKAVQNLVHSKCKEKIEMNLTILTKFQGYLFDDSKRVTESIKINTVVEPPSLTLEDIHGLIQKLADFQGTILAQRKVDVELSSMITKLLTQDILAEFTKESEELLRLLYCCFDFLTNCIRGLWHCDDESGLSVAGNLLSKVWKTSSEIMVYTSSLESSRQSIKELVSTLLDSIAKITKESKDNLVYQAILLHLLLYCCAKDKIFRQLVDFDSLVCVLQPFLCEHDSGAHFLALLSLSFFINDDSPEQQKQILKLEKSDVQLLKLHLAMKQITLKDALHLVKTSTYVSANVALLWSDKVQNFVSQFLDDDIPTEEGKLAAEIITILQSAPEESIAVTNDLLESLLPLLDACNTATLAGSSIDSETCIHIYKNLQTLKELLGTDTKLLLQSISNPILETAAKKISLYIKLRLMDVSGCSDSKYIQIFHSCGKLLIDICRYTTFCQVVVSGGLIAQLLEALGKFREHEEPSEEILARIILCLVLLHLCSNEAIKQYVLDDSHLVASILLHYCHVPYLAIWMFAKVNLMHLGDLFDNKVLEILELTEEALNEFVSGLSETMQHPSLPVQVFGGLLTGNEILAFLAESTILEENSVRMLNVGVLECFPALLQNPVTQIEAARLLWTLTQRPDIKKRVNQEAPLLCEIAKEFSLNATSDIFELLLFSLKEPAKEDFHSLLEYAKGCYSHNMLTECVANCKQLLSHELTPVDIKDTSRVLLAKCQYKQYRKMQRLLSMRPYVDEEYIDQHTSCYALAGQVVQSFKIASQKHANNLDEESLKFLDISLMDISREGNESLKKYRYCLLCKKRKSELQHSHVLPKAILECFTASMGQMHGKKAFKVINFPMKKRFRYFTSKELAFYTFCKDCEKIFNDQGEKGFLNYFKEIYDPEDIDSLTKQHKLVYGTWLYHFCMSLLFRGIATCTGIPDYMDSSQVYQFFLKCRKFLTNEYTLESPELPTIFLLFNPTTVPQEYELQVLNQVLVSPGFFFCDSLSLANGSKVEPPVAQFLVAHVGIMNILVVLTSLDEIELDDKHRVLPSGGTTLVPHDSERPVPKGIWEMFSSLSSDFRKQMQESFFHKKDVQPIPIQTAETEAEVHTQEAFKIVSARLKDSLLFADQCEQESSAVLNLLPEMFVIRKESSVVSLPSDHHLLLHFHTSDQNEKGSTALIGLVSGKGQPVKPFVIHYSFSPTSIFCVGFYLSPEGEVEKVICDSPLEEYPTVMSLVEEVQKSIPTALPVILNAKGFVNMKSLIYHFQHSTFECPLDTKCSTHPRCWYCQNRCENCHERATTITTQPVVVGKVPLKFCGKDCEAVFHGPTKPIAVLAAPTRKSHSDTEKIEEGHTEICCIAGEGIIDGEGLRFKVSVRVGYKSTSNPQGRYYCIFILRTLFEQQCAELFLHRDTSPDFPLPHVNCLEGHKQVQRLKDEEVLQTFIQAGFRVIKRQQQLGLPPSLAQVIVTEEIPAVSVRPLITYHQQVHSPAEEKQIGQTCTSSSTPIVADFSETEESYEDLRQLMPNLPTIHSLRTFELEDVYGTVVQSWKKFTSSNKSTLELDISQILNKIIAFLFQVMEDPQVTPVVMDVLLAILCKCLQSKVHREGTDLSLIHSAIEAVLSQQNCQRRIFAMMVLSNYFSQDQEDLKMSLKLTTEDVQVVSSLVKCKEETEDILLFLDQVKVIEDNSDILRSCGGLELLGKVIDYSEIEQDIGKAAILLEALLSEGT